MFFKRRPTRRQQPRHSSFRPCLEVLEDRTSPAAGMLDPTFGIGGLVVTDPTPGIEAPRAVAHQPDGKIIAVGEVGSGNGGDFAVARYNSDGSLDATFDGDGLVFTPVSGTEPDGAADVVIQSDGKIVAVGAAGGDFAIVRYNSDGSLDTGFDGDGIVRLAVPGAAAAGADGVALQTDGKIVVVGTAARSAGGTAAIVVRLNRDGTPDTSFSGDGLTAGTSINSQAHDVALDGNRIVVAGEFDLPGGTTAGLIRVLASGNLDTNFGNGVVSVTPGSANAIVVTNGAYVVTGPTTDALDSFLARVTSGGNVDPTFGPAGSGGIVPTGFSGFNAQDLEVQADGKLIATGFRVVASPTLAESFALTRFSADGLRDSTFGTNGQVVTNFGRGTLDFGFGADLDAKGRIVVVGRSASRFGLARYAGGGGGQPPSPPAPPPPPTPGELFAVGAGFGGFPHVKVYDSAGTELASFLAFDPAFRGGVRVAVGDFNGDGVSDVYIAASPGATVAHIRIVDGTRIFNRNITLKSTFEILEVNLLANFLATDSNVFGGGSLAAGDLNGDGKDDIILGAPRGFPPHVVVLDAARIDSNTRQVTLPVPGRTNQLGSTVPVLFSFYAFPFNSSAGVNVAAGNWDGVGPDELIVSALRGSHVMVINAARLSDPASFRPLGPNLPRYFDYDKAEVSFSAFPGFLNGAHVAAGDVNGDGKDDVITSPAGPHAGGHVKVFTNGPPGPALLVSQLVSGPMFNGALRVAVVDGDGNGDAEIITAAGPGGSPPVTASASGGSAGAGGGGGVVSTPGSPPAGPPSEVRVLDARAAPPLFRLIPLLASLVPFPGFGGGLFVARS